MTVRLLLTARDAAAALHLIEVARAAARRPDISLEIATQAPATRYFQAAGVATRHIGLPPAVAREDARPLLAAAAALLMELRPDVVLCGLSTPTEGGLDEAVLASFSGPRFVMQDFWGEANLVFGRAADLYLALDEEGVRLSSERHGLPATVVGSPRHSAYAALDPEATRDAERARLGVAPGTTVIGYFGQALHGIEGYRRTLDAWAAAVQQQPGPCLALYRPHPRESADDAAWTMRQLRSAGVVAIQTGTRDVEHCLLACDVVCSAFSNCTYDAAYLNYFSRRPLITPVSLFFDAEIVSYFRRMVRLAEFPYLKAGLVKVVRESDHLTVALTEAAGEEDKQRYWQRARSTLADPARAPSRVLEEILVHHGAALSESVR